jgi:hypothetical protein
MVFLLMPMETTRARGPEAQEAERRYKETLPLLKQIFEELNTLQVGKTRCNNESKRKKYDEQMLRLSRDITLIRRQQMCYLMHMRGEIAPLHVQDTTLNVRRLAGLMVKAHAEHAELNHPAPWEVMGLDRYTFEPLWMDEYFISTAIKHCGATKKPKDGIQIRPLEGRTKKEVLEAVKNRLTARLLDIQQSATARSYARPFVEDYGRPPAGHEDGALKPEDVDCLGDEHLVALDKGAKYLAKVPEFTAEDMKRYREALRVIKTQWF